MAVSLPPGVTLLERNWLSANNVLFDDGEHSALVDSGYCTQSSQTVDLVTAALRGRTLDLLINTHLHSDHCGGNAALQLRYPGLRTLIPPGEAEAVKVWNLRELSYDATGQHCPRFEFDDLLLPGQSLDLAGRHWLVKAAPGHDPHAVLLFEPETRTLISGDALWENGFGVVFPELLGEPSFDCVGDTLDLIESLAPRVVIPGHGSPFGVQQDAITPDDLALAPGSMPPVVRDALARARRRLEQFIRSPEAHVRYALKVLLKFRLLEWQTVSWTSLLDWARQTPYLIALHRDHGASQPVEEWLRELVADLERSGAARVAGDTVYNA